MSSVSLFTSGSWREPHDHDYPVLVADSFVLRDGACVAWEEHAERFRQGVLEVAPHAVNEVDVFLDAVLAQLPRQGEWFPRVDFLQGTPEPLFRLHIRPVPPRTEEAILAVAPHDSRMVPHRKGPDLERMAELRRLVAPRGATEALIVAPDGCVVEGAYSSLIIWGVDPLCAYVTPAEYPRIHSVTERVVIGLLDTAGVSVEARAHTLDDCVGREVWVVSALHGIRLATSVVDGPPLKITDSRRDEFQLAWRSLARTLPNQL